MFGSVNSDPSRSTQISSVNSDSVRSTQILFGQLRSCSVNSEFVDQLRFCSINSDPIRSTQISSILLGQLIFETPTQLVNIQTVNSAGQQQTVNTAGLQSTKLGTGQLSFGLVNSALANSDLATEIQIWLHPSTVRSTRFRIPVKKFQQTYMYILLCSNDIPHLLSISPNTHPLLLHPDKNEERIEEDEQDMF
ncbi:hypothetical protein F511_17402 [Dorcoceras hygrometricum]|uniref:Uncharacterized protein n=1 Tax=Dorcoceras hygrometricum TaxID=472368 RepID=A0A2Z7C263_9LAMI|nr:hypothetical protein F511_17402 [Dorcoceras hygrometricum]